MQNGKDIRYIAAIRLFTKLVEENKEEGKYINDIRGWGTASRQVTFNVGRLRLKRFLAVMANVTLRKKYLGF